MANIRDVAKRAGVAPITVSRCINNSGYCSPDARARIEAAIAELGFVPNRLASGLRSKRTNTLALVLTDITNPFFTTIARGVEDIASEAGYTVIFCNTDESVSKEQMYLQMLLEKRVDGVLLVPALSGIDSVNILKKQATPIVLIDRRLSDLRTDVVRCDSEGGAYDLTRLLLSLGHREIGFLNGPRGVSTAEDRLTGYRRAMAEAGMPHNEENEFFGAFTQDSGFEMAHQAMQKNHKITAVFAANNFITFGTMKAFQEMGLRVPEDIAVVGFDDLPASLVNFPFLTVAAQPAYEMGRKATEILLGRLDGERSDDYQEVVLPAAIVIRQSSGGARERAVL
ncbi:MAG: LacI family DNA-binding transcriptional regulator [Anaerolineales bacterium]